MSRLNPANSRVTRHRAVGLLDQNRLDVLHPMHVDAGNPLWIASIVALARLKNFSFLNGFRTGR
jgi:hypothetical protein